MTKQLLIYEQVVPINKDKHLNLSIKSEANYSFARSINSLPLTAVEIPSAAGEYTIVFTGNQENNLIMPSLILGVRNDENLYVNETGQWEAKYIPAFIRRYPFVFSSGNEGKNFTLCIDEKFAGCNQDGAGERLFDSQGEQTQYLKNILGFLQEYQAHFQRTQIFCQKLKDLDLFEPMQANVTLKSGKKISLGGFMVISREKLKQLSDEQLAGLVRADELELIYLHLQSVRNFAQIVERLLPTVAQTS